MSLVLLTINIYQFVHVRNLVICGWRTKQTSCVVPALSAFAAHFTLTADLNLPSHGRGQLANDFPKTRLKVWPLWRWSLHPVGCARGTLIVELPARSD